MSDRLVSRRFPYVPVAVQIGQRRLELEALIDTGFDGDLVVPPALLGGLDGPDFVLGWYLADGSRVQAPAYLGTIAVGETAPFAVVVTVLGQEPLVGRGVISRFVVTLEHGRRVIIELWGRPMTAAARPARP